MQKISYRSKRIRERGFSLIEMLIVVGVLTTVLAIIFSGIAASIQRYGVEESRLDITQESRDFLDQVIRDLHTIGYPNFHMYNGTTALGGTPSNNHLLAVGLVAVSSTDIWFEGDVDGLGQVRSVRYTLQADAGGNCPCTLMRSYENKTDAAPDAQAVNYQTQLQNVVNSLGGGAAYPITGTTRFDSGALVANDVLYSGYKTAPVFSYIDQNGATLAVPNDLSGGNLAAGEAAAVNVRSVSVVINVLSQYADKKTHLLQGVSTQGTVKLNNL